MTDADQKPSKLDEATKPVTKKPSADVQAWHDKQTRKAIEEADAGDFATDEEVEATVRKFVPNG